MTNAVMNPVKTFALIALGLAIAAIGIYVADADDAPGAAVGGLLLILAGVVLGIGAARNRLPVWAARTAFAVGVAVAAFLAFVLHQVVVTAPLFPGSQGVPSVVDSTPPPQYAVAVERARQLVQAAIVEQNLPGVSVAVGAGGTVVWTRHREAPDLFPTVCGWFERHGFERVWESDPDAGFGVGVHRLTGPSRPLQPGRRLFTFRS